MRLKLTIALSGLLALPAGAGTFDVSVEVPQLNVAEYHRPYVAIWIADAGNQSAANLAVWYQQDRPGAKESGTKWLPDLRQWWRKTGRSLDLPVDGVTGPTRPAGEHVLQFDDKDPRLAGLKPGRYTLVIEAAREVGGRELLKIPFDWPAEAGAEAHVQGESELGRAELRIAP
ncbi:MAG: DUF2271 domain-containing protein [Xanthomonadales bacterium]|nr:DUF2271 domain-containing protein [Xanthomonadales bacterium]